MNENCNNNLIKYYNDDSPINLIIQKIIYDNDDFIKEL